MSSTRKERERKKSKVASARRAAENSAGKQSKAFKLPPGVQRFREKEGEYTLAIVGYEAGKGNPDADEGFLACRAKYYAHRGIGANMDTYLCPAQTYGKPCPVCEFRRNLALEKSWEDESVKALKSSERALWLLVDRNEEKKGLQVLDISHFGFGNLLLEKSVRKKKDAFHSHDSSDEGGFDIEVAFKEEKKGGMTFVKATDIDFKERSEPLSDEIIGQVFDLYSCLVCPNFDELKAIFESGVGSDKEESSDSERKQTPPAPKSAAPKSEDENEDDDEEGGEDEEEKDDEQDDDDEWGDDEEEGGNQT